MPEFDESSKKVSRIYYEEEVQKIIDEKDQEIKELGELADEFAETGKRGISERDLEIDNLKKITEQLTHDLEEKDKQIEELEKKIHPIESKDLAEFSKDTDEFYKSTDITAAEEPAVKEHKSKRK